MWTCATPMIVETKPMIDPTERSMWRMTMTSTMPVAMTAIDDVWTLKFHKLRGDRNRPSPFCAQVMMLKPIQISASALIMPSMRVSTSVALSNRRMADSFGAALVALGAAEVMLAPDLVALRCRRIRRGRRYNRKPRRFTNGAAFFVSLNASAVNSAAELHCARLHAGADFRLGDPALVDDHVEVLPGDREWRQQDSIDLNALGAASERLHVGNGCHLLAIRERHGGVARDLAEVARVLPDRDGLRAKRDAVDRGVVAILARDRHGTGHPWRGERSDAPPGHTVVLSHHRIDLVVILGEDLLHVLLRVVRLPAIGVGLADVLDLAGLHRRLEHFLDAREQEVGVRIALVAFDEGIGAGGLGGQDRFRHHAPDADIVERDVEHGRDFDQ